MISDPASIIQAKEDALAQIKKRMVTLHNLPDHYGTTDQIAQRVLSRATFFAEQYHRQHRWDDLPREPRNSADVSISFILNEQDIASKKILDEEHKMTMIGFFIAVGVERSLAGAIVDYIVDRDPS